MARGTATRRQWETTSTAGRPQYLSAPWNKIEARHVWFHSSGVSGDIIGVTSGVHKEFRRGSALFGAGSSRVSVALSPVPENVPRDRVVTVVTVTMHWGSTVSRVEFEQI